MKKTLLIIVLSSFFYHSQAKTYALIVGINHFKDSNLNLYYSINNATAMRKYIEGVHKHKDSMEILFLTDTFATYSRICKSLEYLSRKTKKNDKLIFYISSHGNSNGASLTYDYGYNWSNIDYTYLKKVFDSSQSKMKYIFIDNCYSGQIIENIFNKDSISGDNYFVFCSSKANEVSWQGSNVENGYFTQYLIDGLTTDKADMDKNKKITIDELYKFVRDKTLRETNGKQTPTIYGRFKLNTIIGKYR